LRKRQVFVKVCPGVTTVSSGMVTSLTNVAIFVQVAPATGVVLVPGVGLTAVAAGAVVDVGAGMVAAGAAVVGLVKIAAVGIGSGVTVASGLGALVDVSGGAAAGVTVAGSVTLTGDGLLHAASPKAIITPVIEANIRRFIKISSFFSAHRRPTI
jgi:hypothetical protein